jgi:hypothetical protein
MGRQLTLAVPDTVTSQFVVATANPPRDPCAAARAYLPDRQAAVARLAGDLLDTPLLEVGIEDAERSEFAAVLAEASPSGGHSYLADQGLRTHHLVVTSHAPPLAQPEHAQAARAVARILAALSEGVVYDSQTGQVLPDRLRAEAEPGWFRLADDWLPVLVSGAPRDDSREPGGGSRGTADAAASTSMETAGLRRFGLPELVLDEAPTTGWPRPLNLLRGVAARLLTDHWDWLRRHPGETYRDLGAHLWVEARDVWGYWGAAPAFGDDLRLRVRLDSASGDCPGAPPTLALGPPAEFPGDRRAWVETSVAPAMPPMTDWPRDQAA